MEYICKLCGKKFEKSGLQYEYNDKNVITRMFNEHLKNDHKITLEEYIIQTEFNGNVPTCKCGCGEKLQFRAKNAIWNPSESFGHYVHCGHVSRHNEKIINKNKEQYKNKYENFEWTRNHYYKQYGKENIENSLNDFLHSDSFSGGDITNKYGIDIRTLKNIWLKLNLITQEQWDSRAKFRKYKLSGARRRKNFYDRDYVCSELYSIMKNNPLKYNIRSLIKYYNTYNLVEIDIDIPVVLNALEEIYGNEIYDYLEFGYHSKQEKEFFNILKFFMKHWHHYKVGKILQYGDNKRKSYIYDICIDNKYIIEYDGEMYHTKENKDYDKRKENFAINKGYKIMRISSKDFKNPDTYKEIIKFVEND